MQDKKVGIVIPIYNVEKYLKECLDSVVNQTYKNLEIILVNDGSTDNSLSIAKGYAKSDARITIITKQNGGLSSARNVGIEYFSGEYSLEHFQNTDGLQEYNIKGNNPLQIYNILNQNKINAIPQIDYFIFLDSDDYWELECIEECVSRMEGVDIVWFGTEAVFEIEEVEFKGELEVYNYDEEKVIDSKTWLLDTQFLGLQFFWWAWQGMIDFKFLKDIKLKFINGIVHEDHHFGSILFFQSRNIYIYPKKLYKYRIRSGSIMNSNSKKTIAKTSYLYNLYVCFEEDIRSTMLYLKYESLLVTLEYFKNFIDHCNLQNKQMFAKIFYPYCLLNAKQLYDFSCDPFNAIERLKNIEQDIQKSYQDNMRLGAVNRIKNQLSYKLGNKILKSKTPTDVLKLPFTLVSIIKEHKFEQKVLSILYKQNPSLKPLPLESYGDYYEALKYKEHLSYKLGQALIKNPFTFVFKLPSIYKNFKGSK